MTTCRFLAIVCIVAVLLLGASSEQCGKQANDALCPNDLCCSEYGWCGDTAHYCCKNCQSQCHCGPVADIISDSLFEEMLEKLFTGRCPEAYGFYTYDDFIDAAKSFEEFGTTGNMTIRKQELAAFLAQTSQETCDGHSGEPFDWGYCIIRERDPPSDYCVNNTEWPCVEGQSYYGRGPIQLRYNYNYGPAGKALGLDLLSNPDLVATDPLVSFKTAIWFWMNPHGSKPAPHAVITGQWVPSDNDLQFGRHPGYGVITNIINGRKECGQGPNPVASNRIGYYKRYCDMLEVGYGDNLDCDNQEPFDPAEFQQLQTF